jgi:hypothetical protein
MIANAIDLVRVTAAAAFTTADLGVELKRYAEKANFHFQDGNNVYWYMKFVNPNALEQVGKDHGRVAHVLLQWSNPKTRLPRRLDYTVRIVDDKLELRIPDVKQPVVEDVPETVADAAKLVLEKILHSCDGHGGSFNGRPFGPARKSKP